MFVLNITSFISLHGLIYLINIFKLIRNYITIYILFECDIIYFVFNLTSTYLCPLLH